MKTILFLGAFAPEIRILQEKLAGQTVRLPATEPLVCEVLEAGIGNLSAALTLQERILQPDRPALAEAIFLGSAGMYGGVLPENYACSCSFYNIEMAVLEQKSKLPAPFCSHVRTSSGALAVYLREKLEAFESNANSPDSITLQPPAATLDSWPAGPTVENMETFGLALAAQKYELPFTAFYALTNLVGPDGSADWLRNHRRMADDLQNEILKRVVF